MAIQKDNIRIMVTISREENEKLKKVADEENRSVSNLASTLIKNYLKDK
ncbi:MAG: DNA-binding protein [Clostridium sp.]|nr:DNA-binding protein [Clostridium sp.]